MNYYDNLCYLENIFLISNNDELFYSSIIKINQKFILPNVETDRAGFLFIYNKKANTLFSAKIKEVTRVPFSESRTASFSESRTASFSESRTASFFESQTASFFESQTIVIINRSVVYYIILEDILREYPSDVLKFLYSRNSIRLGKKHDKEKMNSLYDSLKGSNFIFSRPHILTSSPFFRGILNRIFAKDILNNSSIFSEHSEFNTYGIVIEEDGEKYLTLTNEKMLKVDWDFLNGQSENSKSLYRPYLYEFFPNDTNRLEIENLEIGEIYKVDIYPNIKNKKAEYIDGTVLFGIDELQEEIVYIKLGDKGFVGEDEKLYNNLINTINNIEKITSTDYIKDNIIKDLESLNFDINFELLTFKVGQGNFSKVYIKNKKEIIHTIVYDLGVGRKDSDIYLKLVSKELNKKLETDITYILSHWDLDHIKGMIKLNDEQFKKCWFVPQLPKSHSNFAQRFASVLSKQSSAIFVSDKFNNKIIFDNKHFRMGKGEGINKGNTVTRNGSSSITSYTKNNNLGLILSLKKNEEEILLLGDCEYNQLPVDFYNKNYVCLNISHHGANTNCCLKHLGFKKAKNNRYKAIVTVGNEKDAHGKYRYPKVNHINQINIKGLGYSILESRNFSGNYYVYKL